MNKILLYLIFYKSKRCGYLLYLLSICFLNEVQLGVVGVRGGVPPSPSNLQGLLRFSGSTSTLSGLRLGYGWKRLEFSIGGELVFLLTFGKDKSRIAGAPIPSCTMFD